MKQSEIDEPENSQAFEFGDFRLENHRLRRRDGTQIPLTPRVFDTLRFLVEHNDTVLDKERVMEAVWPDAIVEENNLAQTISKLRQVLGEKPGEHQFIVTVPGRGYRFVAKVKSVNRVIGTGIADPGRAATEELKSQPESAVPAPTATQRRNFIMVAAAILLLAAIALLWWRSSTRKAPNTATVSGYSIPDKSIAVLPFENLSDDKQNAYFVAGIQEEILSNLAAIADLKVISRTSANLYKTGQPRNLREIGEQLGVAHLLEGSVQRAENHLRVHVQLVDARSDSHLWGHTYDSAPENIFAIQSEIAQGVAQQLQARLGPEEKARLETKPTTNPDAYLTYLKALELARVAGSKQDATAADELFAQATTLDPNFALAYARASILNSLIYQLGRDPERKTKARFLAETALRLAPKMPETHVALGVYHYRVENDYQAAGNEFALAGAPPQNDPEILQLTSAILRRQGRWREALATSVRAQELDPRHVHLYGTETHLQLRDWAAAAASYNELIKTEPDLADNWVGLARLEVLRNADPTAARAILDKAPAGLRRPEVLSLARWEFAMLARDFDAAQQNAPDFPAEEFPVREPKSYYEALALFARGELEGARSQLALLLPMHESAARDHPEDAQFHVSLGLLYAWLDRKDDAIRESETAVQLEPMNKNAVNGAVILSNVAVIYARTSNPERAIPLIERLLVTPAAAGVTHAELRLSWKWDPLRNDPRFQKIIAAPEPKTVY
jgi:TolB-like protein/DNA-binding winged helix-turn-helix (wHTH) protein/Flp pilus assembly protein TadD